MKSTILWRGALCVVYATGVTSGEDVRCSGRSSLGSVDIQCGYKHESHLETPIEGDDQDITSFLVCENVSPGCSAPRVVTLQGFFCGALADAEEKEQGR